MCGINGIITNIKSGLNAEELITCVTNMNNAMAHRGPDDEGISQRGNICLGHRRLSIIDLSRAGHQPMAWGQNKQYEIVYNGELYNYVEIKKMLIDEFPTIEFKTQTDTEVILVAMAKWGIKTLERLNGMYAFAFLDQMSQTLTIVRDRLGVKPLYYYHSNDRFLFASEVRSLLASNCIEAKVDQQSLIDYMRYQAVQAPHTIIEGVKMLLPGHYTRINTNTLLSEEVCYWDIQKQVQHKDYLMDGQEVKNEVQRLFAEAVKKSLIADVPFGAFLSGGIDSSAIVGTMTKYATNQVKTFAITFDEQHFSEGKFANFIAKKFDTSHTDIRLTMAEVKNQIPQALAAMDHPTGDGINTYIVSKMTKEAGVTMALSGLGGDELFAGYPVFKQGYTIASNAWIQHLPIYLRRAMGTGFKVLKPSIASNKIQQFLNTKDPTLASFYPISRQIFSDSELHKLMLVPNVQNNIVATLTQEMLEELKHKEKVISAISTLEMSTYMQNTLLRDADQMSMASALEIRVPFLDHNLVEFVLGLNDKFKMNHRPKQLFVDALGDLLPLEITNRKKMGFVFPWANWLKGDLRQFCEARIESLAARTYFNGLEVNQLWQLFLKGDPNIPYTKVWHLIVLENWLNENGIK